MPRIVQIHETYIPPEDTAQEVLESALKTKQAQVRTAKEWANCLKTLEKEEEGLIHSLNIVKSLPRTPQPEDDPREPK